MNIKRANAWLVPALLLLHGSMNILFGALQLDTIGQGPPAVPDEFTSLHYFETPLPIVLHIVAGILFNLLAPFQFAPTLRRRWPLWHRLSGRVLVIAGFLVGLTGLWMNHYYPLFGGALKYTGVLAHSLVLIGTLVIAMRSIFARDIPKHRAWMMRAVAAGLGPATQRIFILPIFFIYGSVNEATVGLVVWWGILLNLAVVEWALWRERRGKVMQLNTLQQETLWWIQWVKATVS